MYVTLKIHLILIIKHLYWLYNEIILKKQTTFYFLSHYLDFFYS